ncbi:hypothetical protein [Pseudomonas sp. MH10]
MGHAGPSLSLVEILRVLYDSVLSFHCEQPYWPDRDRLILLEVNLVGFAREVQSWC